MSTMTSELPLSDLVSRTHADGLSYREMEARARRSGHVISHSQLQAYATGTTRKMPTVDQMRALAAAMDVGYETVRAAAFEQYYNYRPREMSHRSDSRVGAAIPPDLTAEEERELIRMVKAWASARRDHH